MSTLNPISNYNTLSSYATERARCFSPDSRERRTARSQRMLSSVDVFNPDGKENPESENILLRHGYKAYPTMGVESLVDHGVSKRSPRTKVEVAKDALDRRVRMGLYDSSAATLRRHREVKADVDTEINLRVSMKKQVDEVQGQERLTHLLKAKSSALDEELRNQLKSGGSSEAQTDFLKTKSSFGATFSDLTAGTQNVQRSHSNMILVSGSNKDSEKQVAVSKSFLKGQYADKIKFLLPQLVDPPLSPHREKGAGGLLRGDQQSPKRSLERRAFRVRINDDYQRRALVKLRREHEALMQIDDSVSLPDLPVVCDTPKPDSPPIISESITGMYDSQSSGLVDVYPPCTKTHIFKYSEPKTKKIETRFLEHHRVHQFANRGAPLWPKSAAGERLLPTDKKTNGFSFGETANNTTTTITKHFDGERSFGPMMTGSNSLITEKNMYQRSQENGSYRENSSRQLMKSASQAQLTLDSQNVSTKNSELLLKSASQAQLTLDSQNVSTKNSELTSHKRSSSCPGDPWIWQQSDPVGANWGKRRERSQASISGLVGARAPSAGTNSPPQLTAYLKALQNGEISPRTKARNAQNALQNNTKRRQQIVRKVILNGQKTLEAQGRMDCRVTNIDLSKEAEIEIELEEQEEKKRYRQMVESRVHDPRSPASKAERIAEETRFIDERAQREALSRQLPTSLTIDIDIREKEAEMIFSPMGASFCPKEFRDLPPGPPVTEYEEFPHLQMLEDDQQNITDVLLLYASLCESDEPSWPCNPNLLLTRDGVKVPVLMRPMWYRFILAAGICNELDDPVAYQEALEARNTKIRDEIQRLKEEKINAEQSRPTNKKQSIMVVPNKKATGAKREIEKSEKELFALIRGVDSKRTFQPMKKPLDYHYCCKKFEIAVELFLQDEKNEKTYGNAYTNLKNYKKFAPRDIFLPVDKCLKLFLQLVWEMKNVNGLDASDEYSVRDFIKNTSMENARSVAKERILNKRRKIVKIKEKRNLRPSCQVSNTRDTPSAPTDMNQLEWNVALQKLRDNVPIMDDLRAASLSVHSECILNEYLSGKLLEPEVIFLWQRFIPFFKELFEQYKDSIHLSGQPRWIPVLGQGLPDGSFIEQEIAQEEEESDDSDDSDADAESGESEPIPVVSFEELKKATWPTNFKKDHVQEERKKYRDSHLCHMTFGHFVRFCTDFQIYPQQCNFQTLQSIYNSAENLVYVLDSSSVKDYEMPLDMRELRNNKYAQTKTLQDEIRKIEARLEKMDLEKRRQRLGQEKENHTFVSAVQKVVTSTRMIEKEEGGSPTGGRRGSVVSSKNLDRAASSSRGFQSSKGFEPKEEEKKKEKKEKRYFFI